MKQGISVIICSIDDRKFRKVTGNYRELLANEPFEIIGIHDAKSLTEGYNRGFRQSCGSICIFSHDDIRILTPDFAARLRDHLRSFDVVGPVGNSMAIDMHWSRGEFPHFHGQIAQPPADRKSRFEVVVCDQGIAALAGKRIVGGVQLLDGLFIAAQRRVFDKVQFDEQTFDGFHGYDADFSFSAHLAGFRVGAFNDIAIIHDSRGSFDDTWKMYNERFVEKFRGKLAPDRGVVNPQTLAFPCNTEEEVRLAFTPAYQKAMAQSFAKTVPIAAPVPKHSPSMLRELLGAFFGRR